MINRIIGFIFVVLLSGFSSTIKTKNHLEKENLKGKVKSVKETSYRVKKSGISFVKTEKAHLFGSDYDIYKEFNEQGNYEHLSYYESDDSFLGKYTYLYDNDDNNVQLNWYDPTNKLLQEHHYKYDNKGNAIEYKMIYSDDRGLYFTDRMKYDSDGNKIEEIRYHPNNGDVINKKTFKFNKQGFKTEDKAFGKVKSTFQYEFNSRNDRIELREYDQNEILMANIKYNSEGKKIEENTYTSVIQDGGTLSNLNLKRLNDTKITYLYDGNGYLIETVQVDKLEVDKIARELITKYTYDGVGNWVTQTFFTKDTPRSLIEREIIYY